MAEQITLKYSGIYQGNTVSVLISVRGKMIQDLLFMLLTKKIQGSRVWIGSSRMIQKLCIDIRGRMSFDLKILDFLLRGYKEA